MATKKKTEEVEVLEQTEQIQLEEAYEEMEEDALAVDEQGRPLLFPGGPTENMVEEWKSQYGDIYLTEFEEEVFIWRALKRKEYKEVMKINGADNFYKEERICDRVLLWPQNYGFMQMAQGKAGIPTLLSELVMEKSGFQAKTGALRL